LSTIRAIRIALSGDQLPCDTTTNESESANLCTRQKDNMQYRLSQQLIGSIASALGMFRSRFGSYPCLLPDDDIPPHRPRSTCNTVFAVRYHTGTHLQTRRKERDPNSQGSVERFESEWSGSRGKGSIGRPGPGVMTPQTSKTSGIEVDSGRHIEDVFPD
jgi:hypothetical protein